MKKCKCGKEIEDKWDQCYKCAEDQKKIRPAETTDARTASIERQVAAKCVAQALTGQMSVSEGDVTKTFNLFLKLIRGE